MAEQSGGNKLFSAESAAQAFSQEMISEGMCLTWVVSNLHPSGGSCPACSAPIADGSRQRFFQLEQIRCPECGKKFTAATGTRLAGSKLAPRQIYLLAVLLHLGVTTSKIAGVLKCHVDTVVSWERHFQIGAV